MWILRQTIECLMEFIDVLGKTWILEYGGLRLYHIHNSLKGWFRNALSHPFDITWNYDKMHMQPRYKYIQATQKEQKFHHNCLFWFGCNLEQRTLPCYESLVHMYEFCYEWLVPMTFCFRPLGLSTRYHTSLRLKLLSSSCMPITQSKSLSKYYTLSGSRK
jgi:hypothetical protein